MTGQETFDWGSVVARIVHPVKVAIIEALHWMDQPISASELARLFAHEDLYVAKVAGHMRELAKLGLVELVEETPVSGSIRRRYRFPDGRS